MPDSVRAAGSVPSGDERSVSATAEAGSRHPELAQYRAAAALPHADMALASIGLRAQLQLMAAATGARPIWATMTVAGPSRFVGRDGVLWFEWAASVTVSVGWDEVDDNTLDHLAPTLRDRAGAGQTDTARLEPVLTD